MTLYLRIFEIIKDCLGSTYFIQMSQTIRNVIMKLNLNIFNLMIINEFLSF